MNQTVRLNKYFSDAGVCSRRKADQYISEKRILVNGKHAIMGMKVNPETDDIIFEGNPIKKSNTKVYYALYKPRGVVSTSSDEMGRKNVIELVPVSPKVYPVGRLDKNSEGLIILTNDGELTNTLTHPKNNHQKEYEVRVRIKDRNVDINKLENRFLTGVRVEKILLKADNARIEKVEKSDNLIIHVTLHTGYNRQIRKMCDRFDLDILKLKRIRIGKLLLSKLYITPGEYKIISRSSII